MTRSQTRNTQHAARLTFRTMTTNFALGHSQTEIDQRIQAQRMLHQILEGTAAHTGGDFFRSLVSHVAQAFQVCYAMITECTDHTLTRVRTLACYKYHNFLEQFEYNLAGGPCEGVIQGGVLDLLWAKWRDGLIPTELGEHEVPVDVPPGWQWIVRGQRVPTSARAKVRIIGLVVTFPGQSKRLTLRDAATLALLYSDLKKSGKGEILYTRRKYVRKLKGQPPGTVSVTQDKSLFLQMDRARLERLKGSQE